MTVAVGVGVETDAGVKMGRMLALGVDLLPGMADGLLGVAATGVGLMLAVGGSEVLALDWTRGKRMVNASLRFCWKPRPLSAAPELTSPYQQQACSSERSVSAPLAAAAPEPGRRRPGCQIIGRQEPWGAPLPSPTHLAGALLRRLIPLLAVPLLLATQLPQLPLLPAQAALVLRLQRAHAHLQLFPLLL